MTVVFAFLQMAVNTGWSVVLAAKGHCPLSEMVKGRDEAGNKIMVSVTGRNT